LFCPCDTLLNFGYALANVNANGYEVARVIFQLGEFDAERRVEAT